MLRRGLSDVRMLFPRCASVHTCFMLEPIDLVFLSRAGEVVALRPNARPWRFFSGGAAADSVLELGPGKAVELALAIGDEIECQSD